MMMTVFGVAPIIAPTIGGLIIFIPVMVAAIVMPSRVPELYKRAEFKLRGCRGT
jgi:UDP-N-acetylmuramyl pentapeptide phosphotransferase/UDP-N-acetylglucosamine-1-phosphate transferase